MKSYLSNFKSKNGILNIKSLFLISVGGLILSFGLMQMKEKNNLLHQANLLSKVEEEASSIKSLRARYAIAEEPWSRNRQKTFSERNSAPANTNPPFSRSNAISNTENSLMRLKDYIKGIDEKNAFLKEKVDLLKSLLEAKEKEIVKLNEDNAAIKDNLNKAVEIQNKIRVEFEGKLQALNSQLAQRDSDSATLNTLKIGLEYQVEDLNKKLSALSSAYNVLKNSLQDKTALEAELSKAKEDLRQQKVLNETLNKNVTDMTDSVNSKEKEIFNLTQELEQLRSSKNAMESELSQLKTMKADNEDQVNQLKQRINELSASYEETKKSALQLSSTLAKKELEKELEISGKENEITNVKDNLYKANTERDSLTLSLDEKEKKIRQLEEKLNSAEPRVTELQNELNLEKERQSQVTQQLDKAMELNNSLKSRLKNIAAELELLRTEKKINVATTDAIERETVSRDTITSKGSVKKDTSSYIKVRREVMP